MERLHRIAPLQLQRQEPTVATRLNWETFSRRVALSEKWLMHPMLRHLTRAWLGSSQVHLRQSLTTCPTPPPSLWRIPIWILCTRRRLFRTEARQAKIFTWRNRFTRAASIRQPRICFINTAYKVAIIQIIIITIIRRRPTLQMVSYHTRATVWHRQSLTQKKKNGMMRNTTTTVI